MNKYKVKISHVFTEVLDVEAANEEEAKEKAKIELQREDRPAAPRYETTIPLEHWPVISEDKYNEMVKQLEAELENQKDSNKEESNIITPNIITP